MKVKVSEQAKIHGRVKLTFHDVITGKEEVLEYNNLICDAGRESWAGRATGADNLGKITYLAVGLDNTAPNASDTALGDELYRKQVSSATYTANEAEFRTFFSTDEANDTLEEIGLFGDDASATPDSGTLFAKRAISRTKVNTETLTVSWTITF